MFPHVAMPTVALTCWHLRDPGSSFQRVRIKDENGQTGEEPVAGSSDSFQLILCPSTCSFKACLDSGVKSLQSWSPWQSLTLTPPATKHEPRYRFVGPGFGASG